MRLVTEWPVERGLVARAALLLLAAATALAGCRTAAPVPAAPTADTEAVGRHDGGRTVLPVNQVVTPAGLQVELPGLRPQALALSPDGRLLLTAGQDGGAGRRRSRRPASSGSACRCRRRRRTRRRPPPTSSSPTRRARSASPACSSRPDGRRAFLSDVNGSVVVFDVARRTAPSRVARSIALPRRERAPPPRGDPRRPRRLRGRVEALRLRQPVEHARSSSTSPPGASCASSTSASRRTTSCSSARRRTSRTGADAGRGPAISPAPPAAAPR